MMVGLICLSVCAGTCVFRIVGRIPELYLVGGFKISILSSIVVLTAP